VAARLGPRAAAGAPDRRQLEREPPRESGMETASAERCSSAGSTVYYRTELFRKLSSPLPLKSRGNETRAEEPFGGLAATRWGSG